MNRALSIVFLLVLSISCREEEILEPFFYPELLNFSVEIVEVFDDNSILAGSDAGVYYRNADGEEFIVDIGGNGEFDQKNVPSMRFYKGGDKVFGVNASWILEIKDDEGDFYANTVANATYGDAMKFTDYGIDRDGRLFAVSYGEVIFDENLWQNFYELHFNRWQAATWVSTGTNIVIRDLDIVEPSFDFSEDYLYVSIGDIYEFDYVDLFNYEYELLVPNTGGADYQNMHQLTYEDDELYATNGNGFSGGSPYLMYSFNLRSGNFRDREFNTRCDVPPFASMDYQIYHQKGLYAFVRTEVEQSSFNSQDVVYIVNQVLGTCERYEMGSQYTVDDIAYDPKGKALYLATLQGLITYDLESEVSEPYLNKLIEP